MFEHFEFYLARSNLGKIAHGTLLPYHLVVARLVQMMPFTPKTPSTGLDICTRTPQLSTRKFDTGTKGTQLHYLRIGDSSLLNWNMSK